MARPIKVGLDYFPMDVDIDTDDKVEVIEAEFGIVGFGVIVKLLCKIYKDNGYYYEWGDRERLLFSKRSGVDSDKVQDILNSAFRWGLFDEEIYKQSNVITSGAIQRRYLDAIVRRDRVEVIKEYCLIDVSKYKNVVIVSIKGDIVNNNSDKEDEVGEPKAKKTKAKKRGSDKFNFLEELVALGVEENVASEWLKVRKAKKAVNSEFAFKAFVREADKTGKSYNEVVLHCVENSWKGFRAEWINDLKNNSKQSNRRIF